MLIELIIISHTRVPKWEISLVFYSTLEGFPFGNNGRGNERNKRRRVLKNVAEKK